MKADTKIRHIEIEIGCGTGEILALMAEENPDRLFLGIDISSGACEIAQRRLKNRGLSNAMVVHAEAFNFLVENIPDSSISGIHIYFPTPYIKDIRAHNPLGQNVRNWLVSANFVKELYRISAENCTLRVATDHRRYFDHIARLIDILRLSSIPWVSPVIHRKNGQLIGSKWEIEQRNLGKKIYYIQCVI